MMHGVHQLFARLEALPYTSVARVHITALDISATDIRRRIRPHEPVRYLLPEAVQDAVLESGAYETT